MRSRWMPFRDAGGALLDWLLEIAYQRVEQDLATK